MLFLAPLLAVPTATALPLVSERFDTTGLVAGWKVGVGAQTGGGVASTWAITDGALVLHADPHTKRFTLISRKMELRDVSWLSVQARVKTEGLDPARDPGVVCDVVVRFEGGPLQAAHPCGGDADWTPFTRYFPVPEGARDVEVGFLLSGAGTASFDDLLVEAVDPGWKTLRRDHFVYHWLGADAFTEEQLTENDDNYDKFLAFFGTTRGPTIDYQKYPNLDTLTQYTGRREEASVDGDTIQTIWRGQTREIVQVLARAWGDPPALLSEGIAVHLAGEWDGRAVKQSARGLVGRGEAPTLASLLDPKTFHSQPAAAVYPYAGAFVGWIVETKGAAALQAVYGKLHAGASVEDNQKALEAALGMSLPDADTALRAWL